MLSGQRQSPVIWTAPKPCDLDSAKVLSSRERGATRDLFLMESAQVQGPLWIGSMVVRLSALTKLAALRQLFAQSENRTTIGGA